MAAGGEGITSQIAGMSKNQLFEIMSQMKTLIEQNQKQARQILIKNPTLTKSLFQAQIMLGMVRPPQVMPNIQQALSQHPQQSSQTGQPLNVQASQLAAESGSQGQPGSSQPQFSARQQYPSQSSVNPPQPTSLPLTFQSQAMPSHSIPSMQQAKSPFSAQVPAISLPQTSQMHNLPPPPPPPVMQHPLFQSHGPAVSNQSQHPMQSSGVMHQPLQPPLPPQPRPPSMQPFQHQLHSQIPQNLGFQPLSAPPQIQSQPMFHSGANLQNSFAHGQPPLPTQPPVQHHYQGSPHTVPEFGNQGSTPMQVDRGSPWAPGLPDNATSGGQLPGPPPLPMSSGQMGPGPGGQQPRPSQLSSEMEKALLQQVMSLTPEQINLLPHEQRQQVLQLQQMLR